MRSSDEKDREGVDLVRRHWIVRHTPTVRTTHWMNAGILLVLLMTGLQIFNAHPALYWGRQSIFAKPWLIIGAETGSASGGSQNNGSDEQAEESGQTSASTRGVLVVAGHSFTTTGVLGVSMTPSGEMREAAFPGWATIPSNQNLATGRRWHFLFAWLLVLNGLAYLAHSLWRGHLQRELVPTGDDLRDIPRSIGEHVRFRFPRGEKARRYNVIQKLSYLSLLVALVVMVLAGLTMSPGLDAAFPMLLDLFGGRQSARSVHFIVAWSLVLFTVVHVALVFLAGFANLMRSMITGRFDLSVARRSLGDDA